MSDNYDGPAMAQKILRLQKELVISVIEIERLKGELTICENTLKLTRSLPKITLRDPLVARVAELEKALKKYGKHAHDCRKPYGGIAEDGVRSWDAGTCTCGFDAALSTP